MAGEALEVAERRARESAKKRTPTTAAERYRTGGCSLARTMSHALTASSATADASAANPAASAGQNRRAGGIAPRSTPCAVEPRRCRRAHTITSLGSRRTTSSAIARALVRCEISRTAAPSSASCAHARATVGLGVGVERGAGLIERDDGSPPRAGADRRRGRRRRAAPARPTDRRPARRARLGVDLVGARERERARARARVGGGVAERDVVAHRPGDEPGLLSGPREPRRGREVADVPAAERSLRRRSRRRRAAPRRRWTCRRRSDPRGG